MSLLQGSACGCCCATPATAVRQRRLLMLGSAPDKGRADDTIAAHGQSSISGNQSGEGGAGAGAIGDRRFDADAARQILKCNSEMKNDAVYGR